ncbi:MULTISPECIES: hydroxyacylglutathione hydrolase [Acinetobacter calcoaceticus/baumannii complex]|uniref:hydroxyacylglutathione hydrolase n=1 Tax=Acinetobacter calcoaceticus/baumannii complex TaxID=909768 RepID=UPI0007074C71|nr:MULTISPECIES: hydroxyacylglutathione hydrolase [Acinetobacter calcoaceticus/baumannii complex]KQE92425.1 hydroxyacylglutathione hydrolase [Acinetobacter lactucae]QWZ58813.1 hydroxyacylglutathione hydrolase [Acinetobacter pittii]
MRYRIHFIDVQNALQNYIWILEDTETQQAVAVDPTEAELVTQFCQNHQLTLTQIWLTHWHKDHIGGVADLTAAQNITVYGPRDELTKIPGITHPLQHNDHLKFNDLKVEIIATPGHTLGHIVYFIEELEAVFCGDTLFAMGCGRLFEGTAEQMYHSLSRLAALPTQTKVYCTHEYTLSNAEFALTVEPHNHALSERAEEVRERRKQGSITLPSTIELELATNPFLRAESVEDFAHLRALKDNF